MNEIAISVRNLSKKYHLYESPQHRLKEALHPFRKKYHREFWALKDVSFDVKKGETIGIIGTNGSGKSTLLQMLCGTLQPSEGKLQINGRISALLELGAGFNPEFTGRDNVYMNAALMGFTREAINERFDAIASFADIGEFLDQPVKTYSSGMYVRLAFATAVNVDPDILIIDEALAVGDLRFQKKCKEKMNEFKESGITIVLVSHSMSDINTMCHKALFLKTGQIAFIGSANDVINAYTYEENKAELQKPEEKPEKVSVANVLSSTYGGDRGGTGDIYISNVACYQKGQEKTLAEIDFGKNIIVEFDYEAIHKIEKPIFRLNFSVSGCKFFANIDSTDTGLKIPSIKGKGKVVIEIKHPNLYPQAYKVNVAVRTEDLNTHLFFWNEAGSFLVRPPEGRNMSYPTALVELESEVTLTCV